MRLARRFSIRVGRGKKTEKKPETKPNATNKTNTTAPAKPSSSQIDGNDLIAIKKTKVETANSTANATK